MKTFNPDRYNKEAVKPGIFIASGAQVLAQERACFLDSSRAGRHAAQSFGEELSGPTFAQLVEQGHLQATPNDLYYPAALEAERAARKAATLDACAQRRARRIYQVLALLGWVAAVTMGVFG